MGSLIGGIIVLIIGLVIGWLSIRNFNNHKFIGVIGIIAAIFFLCLGGLGGIPDGLDQINHTGDYSPKAISESKAKESSKAESRSSSEKYESSVSSARKQAKADGVKSLNSKLASDPQLSGISVKKEKSDSQFDTYDVTVPDVVANGSEEDQKSIYKNLFKIIERETGSQNPNVFYYDNAGNELAETNWAGEIKLK